MQQQFHYYSWALGNWISKETNTIFAIIKELQVHELKWHINRFESRVVPGYQGFQKSVGPCLRSVVDMLRTSVDIKKTTGNWKKQTVCAWSCEDIVCSHPKSLDCNQLEAVFDYFKKMCHRYLAL